MLYYVFSAPKPEDLFPKRKGPPAELRKEPAHVPVLQPGWRRHARPCAKVPSPGELHLDFRAYQWHT